MKNDSFDGARQGRVIKKNLGWVTVWGDGESIACTLAAYQGQANNRARALVSAGKGDRQPIGGEKIGNEVVVGDEVLWLPDGHGSGRVVQVLPRRSRFSRRAAAPKPGSFAREQVLVANVTQVVPVFAAAEPLPSWNMLDRYLVSAEAFGLPAVICLTKADLLADYAPAARSALEGELAEYERIGYPVLRVSSHDGTGLEAARQVLRGELSVLLGKSGVGKTSLLNALQPGLGLKVSRISQATGKGRHITTAQEMFLLDWGGAIVDTPGEREFGLWDVESDDLALFFPEMRPWVGACRFGLSCRHDEEPGCAVRSAALNGQISPRRYHSYQRLRTDP